MRWSPQMSRIAFLLTSQLRPLSPKAAALHCIYWPPGETVSPTAVRLASVRAKTAWQRMSSFVIAAYSSGYPGEHIPCGKSQCSEQIALSPFAKKKGALKPSLPRKEGVNAPA